MLPCSSILILLSCSSNRNVLPDQRLCPLLSAVSESAQEETRGKTFAPNWQPALFRARHQILRSLGSNFYFFSLFSNMDFLVCVNPCNDGSLWFPFSSWRAGDVWQRWSRAMALMCWASWGVSGRRGFSVTSPCGLTDAPSQLTGPFWRPSVTTFRKYSQKWIRAIKQTLISLVSPPRKILLWFSKLFF